MRACCALVSAGCEAAGGGSAARARGLGAIVTAPTINPRETPTHRTRFTNALAPLTGRARWAWRRDWPAIA